MLEYERQKSPQEIRSPSKSERKVESLYFKIPKDSLAESRGGDGYTWGWGSRLKVTGKWQSSSLSLRNTFSEDQWVFRALTPLCWPWLVRTAGCLGNLLHLAPSFIDTGICLSGLWPVYVSIHFHQLIIRKASELRRNKWVHDLKLEKTFSFQRLTRETVEFLWNHTQRTKVLKGLCRSHSGSWIPPFHTRPSVLRTWTQNYDIMWCWLAQLLQETSSAYISLLPQTQRKTLENVTKTCSRKCNSNYTQRILFHYSFLWIYKT